MSDWLDFKADYFERVCREVFDGYLKRHRFGPGRADETGSLLYRRGRCFLEIHYYVEDRPNYAPMVSIGLVSRLSLRSRSDGIGLWYAISQGIEAREYECWRFSSAEELRKVLMRIRDEAVEVYARALWEDPNELARLVDERLAEIELERNADVLGKKKAEAEHAFQSRDYVKAAALYGRMGESELSPIERKRYAYSKKRIS